MNAHQYVHPTRQSWEADIKRYVLGLWRSLKRLANEVERSMDTYDKMHMRGW
jgi:hypothetical protein